jgi:hypothetical protein
MVLFVFVMLVMLIVQYWHIVVGVLILFLLWRYGFEPWRQAQIREAHDRLRHARARREIDRITFETARAMHQAAAHANGEVIDATAVEVRGE